MSRDAPKIGEVIGSYCLTALLGRGGMASVYLADHTRLARRAAVKVLATKTAIDDVAVSRFLTEARLISEIQHPGVVHILDVIEQQDPLRYAYVMEHVDGPTLRKELDRRPPSPVEVARLGLQLTESLRAIHARQVVHRDLKPSNVLLTGPVDGTSFPLTKLADFGIAKAQDRPAPHKTATGLIIGTPTYMAPEQVTGEPITPATDIYALGELLYEMFTGKRVFPEDQRTSLRMKLDPEPPPLEPLPFPDAGAIWELIRSCLDPEASRRPSHDVIVEVLQTIDAAPVPLGFVTPDRPTQLQHTATFAGPLFAEPDLAPARVDPVTAPGPAPSVEMPRPTMAKAPRWPLAVGGAALLAAVGVVGAMLTVEDEPLSYSTPAPKRAPAEAKPPASPPEPAVAPAPAPEVPAATPPARVQFELTSRPPGARVEDAENGRGLGTTPLKLEILEGASRRVRVSKRGYMSEVVEVDGQADVKVPLKRRRARPKRPARAKPTPEAPASEDLMPW